MAKRRDDNHPMEQPSPPDAEDSEPQPEGDAPEPEAPIEDGAEGGQGEAPEPEQPQEPELLGRPVTPRADAGLASDFRPQAAPSADGGGDASELVSRLDKVVSLLERLVEARGEDQGEKRPESPLAEESADEGPATLGTPGPSHPGPPDATPDEPAQLGPQGPAQPAPHAEPEDDTREPASSAPPPDDTESEDQSKDSGGDRLESLMERMLERLESIDHAVNSDDDDEAGGVRLGSAG